MAKKVVSVFLIVFISLLTLSGCFMKKTEEEIILPEDSPFYTNDWAVVIDPYTPFYKSPSDDSDIEGYARRGDALEVKGRKIINSKDIWYNFEKGWMPEKSLKVYSNRRKAERAALTLD